MCGPYLSPCIFCCFHFPLLCLFPSLVQLCLEAFPCCIICQPLHVESSVQRLSGYLPELYSDTRHHQSVVRCYVRAHKCSTLGHRALPPIVYHYEVDHVLSPALGSLPSPLPVCLPLVEHCVHYLQVVVQAEV